jgi:uncharacterized protein YecT (DUF1311 family)
MQPPMRRLASIALVTVVGGGFAAIWTQVAAAKTTEPSPVASYTMSYWLANAPANPFPLTLKENGHFIITTPFSTAGGTWKEVANVVTLTTPKTPGNHWVYTIHREGANLGSQSHPGKVTLDGKPWSASWYAVRNTRTEVNDTRTKHTPTATAAPVFKTANGRLLWNLKDLLRSNCQTGDQVELDLCTGRDLVKEQAQLNSALSVEARHISPSLVAAAQDAWKNYEAVECQAVAEINRGGTIYPQIVGDCEISLTIERIKEVESATAYATPG